MALRQNTSLTEISAAQWSLQPSPGRLWEKTVALGRGDSLWDWATTETLCWGVKTRSGFSVEPARTVARGDRPVIAVHALGITILEPVEVVDVVRTGDRVGFAYRTLPGHPVTGEEAFIVHRENGVVRLTIRSVTRPSRTLHWRALFPLLLIAQRVARRRYMRALKIPTER
ncbi:DUF1990 family protein [Microbacterium sp. ASV49]|uniref:DUF1990 domain-containing protein n=1 Tax=Microbacterium candidum TaxID=3041922 RepID=A0ABT7MY40_9MICO|nr:DUF1990 domain-containing protein [Microbacterium sp. ASV49]MDL9979364.1 DUF1990 domain-containing protein [Microbacterium sp. ASV49]